MIQIARVCCCIDVWVCRCVDVSGRSDQLSSTIQRILFSSLYHRCCLVVGILDVGVVVGSLEGDILLATAVAVVVVVMVDG